MTAGDYAELLRRAVASGSALEVVRIPGVCMAIGSAGRGDGHGKLDASRECGARVSAALPCAPWGFVPRR